MFFFTKKEIESNLLDNNIMHLFTPNLKLYSVLPLVKTDSPHIFINLKKKLTYKIIESI